MKWNIVESLTSKMIRRLNISLRKIKKGIGKFYRDRFYISYVNSIVTDDGEVASMGVREKLAAR